MYINNWTTIYKILLLNVFKIKNLDRVLEGNNSCDRFTIQRKEAGHQKNFFHVKLESLYAICHIAVEDTDSYLKYLSLKCLLKRYYMQITVGNMCT